VPEKFVYSISLIASGRKSVNDLSFAIDGSRKVVPSRRWSPDAIIYLRHEIIAVD